jgi:integrase/recombinase XerD
LTPATYKREPLTTDEAERLSEATPAGRSRLIVWTLLDTGLRVSELASLSPQSIEWQRHRLRVYGKGGPFGKRSKLRIVPLSGRVAPILEGYFSSHDSLGITVRTVQRIVGRSAELAGVRRIVTPHVLRHTFAVEALRRGVSLVSINRILGHDNLETTAIYLNVSADDVERDFRAKF